MRWGPVTSQQRGHAGTIESRLTTPMRKLPWKNKTKNMTSSSTVKYYNKLQQNKNLIDLYEALSQYVCLYFELTKTESLMKPNICSACSKVSPSFTGSVMAGVDSRAKHGTCFSVISDLVELSNYRYSSVGDAVRCNWGVFSSLL